MQTDVTGHLGLRDLFFIFLKAGLAFGGGLGILSVLEDELVARRRALSRDAFLATYGLGRIVPSGTMTALAVGFGYRFGGLAGTVVALSAMVLPGFTIAVLLTAGFLVLRGTAVLELLPVTILPAALAFIVAAALRLGQTVFRPSVEMLLAVAGFVAVVVLDLSPGLVLVAGGLVGMLVLMLLGQRGAAA